MDELASHAQLTPFLADDFDATAYTVGEVRGGRVAATVAALADSAALVDRRLATEVSANYKDLLVSVGEIRELETLLQHISSSVSTLSQSMQKVWSEVREPYCMIKARTQQSQRVHATVLVLRKIIRFLVVLGKLKQQQAPSAPSSELPKSALSLMEIESILADGSLDGIEIVENERAFIHASKQQVLTAAQRLMSRGLEMEAQTEIAVAAQTYFNMNILQQKVEAQVRMNTEKISSTLKAGLTANFLLDLAKISSTNVRSPVWSHTQHLLDNTYPACAQVWHLERVLARIKAPNSHTLSSLSSLLAAACPAGSASLTLPFWQTLLSVLKAAVQAVCSASNILDMEFTSGFPILVRQLQGMLSRLHSKGAVDAAFTDATMAALAGLEQRWAAGILATARAELEHVFVAQGDAEEAMAHWLETLAGVMKEVLSIGGSAALTQTLARILHECCEALLEHVMRVTRPAAASAAAAAPTTPAARLPALFNCVQMALRFLHTHRQSFPAAAQGRLGQCSALAADCGTRILHTHFISLHARAATILGAVHTPAVVALYTRPDAPSALDKHSPYVDDVTSLCAELATDLAQYSPCLQLTRFIRTFAHTLLALFARHVSLVRPLCDEGRAAVCRDLAGIAQALTHLSPTRLLGGSLQAFIRALKTAVFLSLDDFASLAADALYPLPPSVTLHIMLAHADAADIPAPHTTRGQTLPEYMAFLEEGGEAAAWEGLRGCLEQYARSVDSKGLPTYSPVYVAIMRLAPQLVKFHCAKQASEQAEAF